MLANSLFCLSVIVITLRNCPRGESSRDVMLINLMRLILHTEFADERLESPLIYNNLISPDLSIELRDTNGPEAPVQSGAGRSNAAEAGAEATSKPSDNEEEDCPPGHVSATDEDSDEELPRQRRRRRKRKYDEAAAQPLDSSSGNDDDDIHHRLKRRKQRRSVQSRANGSPGRSRTRTTLAGRKRICTKCWPRREEYANKDKEDETLTSLLETRRKTHKRPAQPGSSRSKEPVLGPSGKTTGWPKGKGQHFQFRAKAPSQESQEASSKEPLTGRRKRKRPRKDDEDPTKSPSTTDSEEAQPKPLRKRKKKKRQRQ